MKAKTFYYLATVYSIHPEGIHAAFEMAARAAVDLVKAGVLVFSPIVHTHPLAVVGCMDPYDHDIWIPIDTPMMEAASGLIVLKSNGWLKSKGIKMEIKKFREDGKPIFFMDPGIVPGGL